MEALRKQVGEASAFISSQLKIEPKIALISGTGLGGALEEIDRVVTLPYAAVPHYPVSTVPSHTGQLICGKWAGESILAMQGRFHLYEGYSPGQISFPIRVFAALGIQTLIILNAAGGLNPQYKSGDLMLIADHINLTGQNPLAGPNVAVWGPRFPDMTEPYSFRLQDLARQTALDERILLHQGVYAGVLGPSLETAAETRMLRFLGADAVGMSTIMEVITAVHAGMEVLGCSVITNVNLPDCYKPASVEEIIATAEQAGPRLTRLLFKIMEQL